MDWLKKMWHLTKYWIRKIMEEKFLFDGFAEEISAADVFYIDTNMLYSFDGGEPEPVILIVFRNGASIKAKATDHNLGCVAKISSIKRKYGI